MKKITLILALLMMGLAGSYAQCTTSAGPLSAYNMTNNGLPETITTAAWIPEYIVANNFSIGNDYVFTLVQTSNSTAKYITITDTSNNVIAHGMSPLTVTAISAASVRIHGTNTAACTGSSNSSHVITAQVLLTCPVPLQVSFSGVTTTTANFTWQAGGTETAWEALLIPDTDPAPTSATTGEAVNGTPAFNGTDLDASTAYKFYVRANCGSEFSPWTVAVKFNTLCEAFGNFTEDFESTATATVMPLCWNKKFESSSTSSYVYVSASGGNNAVKSLVMGNSAGANAKIYAITPQLSDLPLQTHRLKFFSKGSTTATLEVGTMTDPNNAATFTSIATFPLTATHIAHTVNFDAPTTATFIAFRGNFTTTYYTINIDDVVWEELPSCPDTAGLAAGTVTSSTANISWTAGTATAWQYAIGAATDTDPDTLSAEDVSTASVSIPVDPSTTYKVWVRANCNGNYGGWTAPVTFTTPCEATPAPTDIQNFDATTGAALPECWSTSLISGTTPWKTVVASTDYDITTSVSPTRILFKDYTTSSALVFTQPMDFSGVTAPTRVNLYLHRHASADIADEYKIFVNTTATLTGATQILQQFSKTTLAPAVAATGWYKNTADIPVSFNGAPQVFIIIQGITTAGLSSYALGIEDFQVEYVPSCVEPTQITVSNVTSTTATLSWTAPASAPAQGYAYAYSTTNTSADAADFTGTTVAGTTTVELTDLDANTTFYFWVKSVCSSSDESVWTLVKSFKTACESFDGFTEDFENTATGTVMPDCWNRKIESTSTSSYVYVSATGGNIAAKSLVMGNSGGTNAKIYAITPPLNDLPLQTHRLKFFSKGTTTATLEVGTMTDPNDSTTFTSIATFPLTATHAAHTVNFDAPTTATYIAFRGNFTSTYYTINIDDVVWQQLPTCLEPSGVQFSNVSTTTATVNWTASSTPPAQGYEYAYSTSNTSPASAEFVGTVNAGVLTASLSDLSPSSTYFFWIRSVCSANDTSEWSAVSSFTTACGPTASFTEGFETTAASTVMPNCWSKKIISTSSSSYIYVSTSEAHASTKALRMGNSDGTNAVSYAITPPLTNIGAQTHSLTFYALGSPGIVFKVGTMTDPADETTFSEMATFTLTSTHQLFTVDFTQQAAAGNHIAFRAQYNATYNYVSIDDVQWQPSLSAPSFDMTNFKAYPNPVKDILNLSYVNNISDVAVYNILGQQVMTRKVNDSIAKLDMSALSAGTYIVKVTADSQTKSIKVIKQ